ncbi:uncharacterized protein LOC135215911 [Macrobrachium nipponense]|uniref:uncharacterized protein LOC135215911 n=1 Tax=Macrobrachium nipponense TaxID=159736 RepID=UPI0030C83074
MPSHGASCNNCGRTGHWPRTQKCPAKEVQCKTCQKQGHFEKMCRSTKKSQTGYTASPPPNKSNPSCRFMGNNLGRRDPPHHTVSLLLAIYSAQLQLIPDTGGRHHSDWHHTFGCTPHTSDKARISTHDRRCDSRWIPHDTGCRMLPGNTSSWQQVLLSNHHVHEDIQTPSSPVNIAELSP